MNRRTLKKQCKRAMEILIAEHQHDRADFKRADGEESIYVPHGMERRYSRHGFIAPGPLKGTWLLWKRVSYEYNEWDAFLPSEELKDIIFWRDFDYSEYENSNAAKAA